MGRRPARETRRPRLGQNFLADPRAAERIVNALGDVSQRVVIEIGPGRGALTSLLANRAGYLIAIELDRVLGAQLRMKHANRPNLEIVEGDVLDIDLGRLMRRERRTSGDIHPGASDKAVVVGNLPYYITSPILLHLLRFHEVMTEIVIMVQKEVADRIAAKPGSRDYGLLSATTQLYAKIEKLFTLPPGAFAPPPKVHSTVLRLTVQPQVESLKVSGREFEDYLKLSFGQKRKTLRNNLRERYQDEDIRRALAAAGVKADERAEAISLAKAASMFRHLRGTQ
ncbi:MAG: 16S rRNA (adenine(1518)-N(6)/adenine(1519)-N(6))-dimethyltransferase RsmA [Acidobacteriia bacterium]|nr:16S rRNA (adenine(1518)-N(6)/adenine(1519)-N(6))-dimethyltransferase RsmA [Terriglobia bacterium]